MSAILAYSAPEEARGIAARKAELFDHLDTAVDGRRILSEIVLPKTVPALHNVQPVTMPRHVWLYWHDGWQNAPEIALLCLQSWKLRNPGHEVHALDQVSLPQFLPRPPVHASASKLNGYANRVRLKLLRTHGGVWADATLFCTQPLESWLGLLMPPARAFAFASPAADRIVATWFLAAIPHAPLMRAWERLYAAYFAQLEAERRWVHAYFAMSYVLEYAVTRHEGLRALWALMPKVPAPESGLVSSIAGLKQANAFPTLDAKECEAVAAALTGTNMQKLTWKGGMRTGTPAAAQILDILRENLTAAARSDTRPAR